MTIRVDLRDYYRMGTYLQYIHSLSTDATVVGDRRILWMLQRMKDLLQKNNLEDKVFKNISDHIDCLKKYNDKEVISKKDRDSICDYVRRQSPLLLDCMNDLICLRNEDRCIINKELLLKLAQKEEDNLLINLEIWEVLSDTAQSDLSDAAKCLLIGLSTPAAMISVRAGEEVVRTYYQEKTNSDYPQEAWGILTDKLKKTPNINKNLINLLDYIRITKRNVLQHPEKICYPRESERIFLDIVNMIHEIFEEFDLSGI